MVYEMSNLNMDVKSFNVTCATNPRFLKKFLFKVIYTYTGGQDGALLLVDLAEHHRSVGT